MPLEYALVDEQNRREALADDFAEWYEEKTRQEEDLEMWYAPEGTEFSEDSW